MVMSESVIFATTKYLLKWKTQIKSLLRVQDTPH